MADDVQITIGASLQDLIDSVEGAKSVLGDLAKAFGVAFAVDMIGELISQMGELAEQTERTATILGVTTAQVQELGLLARMTGGSAEQLYSSLERMNLGLQRGQNVTSSQAAAFRALGLSVQQMMQLSPDQQFLKLADSVKRLNDQGINAAPALMLINRGLANMMPQLVQGSAGIQDMEKRMQDVGAVVVPDVTKKLAEMEKNVTLLKAAFTGLAEVLISKVAGAFSTVGDEITKVIGRITLLSQTNKLAEYFGTLLDGVKRIMEQSGPEGMGGIAGGDEVQNQIRKVADDTHAALAKIISSALGQFDAAIKGATTKPISVNTQVGKQEKDRLAEARSYYDQQVALANEMVETYQITESQKTEFLIAQLHIREAQEIAAGQSIGVAEAKMNADIAKVNAQYAKQVAADWKKVADQLASDFSSALDKVLSGQATFGQAMTQMFGQMIEQMIAKVIQLIAEYIILNAVAAMFPGLGAGPSFMGLASKMFGFAAGTPYVSQGGVAMIHQGEAIIPAQANPWGSGDGGMTTNNVGGNISLNISAIDSRSIAQMFLSNKNVLNAIIAQIARTNPGGVTNFAQAGGL